MTSSLYNWSDPPWRSRCGPVTEAAHICRVPLANPAYQDDKRHDVNDQSNEEQDTRQSDRKANDVRHKVARRGTGEPAALDSDGQEAQSHVRFRMKGFHGRVG